MDERFACTRASKCAQSPAERSVNAIDLKSYGGGWIDYPAGTPTKRRVINDQSDCHG